MSIKRRMRRLNAEEEKPPEPAAKAAPKGKAQAKPPEPEEKPEGLPERQWQGLPKFELRALLVGGSWPEDPQLQPDDDKVKELTDILKSFRSCCAQMDLSASLRSGRLHGAMSCPKRGQLTGGSSKAMIC